MAKKAKKAVKKAGTKKSSGDHVERRKKVIGMLLRKNGASLAELVEAGHNQPAQAALKMAETRGLKTSSNKEEGGVTRYYATGTPSEPTRKPKKAAKKAAAKKPVKKAAKKKTKKPAKAPAAEVSAAA